MFRHLLSAVLLTVVPATAQAVAPVEVELVTERGLQTTAPQQWLQLLSEVGVRHVRVLSSGRRVTPKLENRGTESQPSYFVVGIITSQDRLKLPAGDFDRGDRARLREYFTRLANDGAEGVIAPRGRFGLTELQYTAAHRDLAKSISFSTKGQPLRAIVDQLSADFVHEVVLDRSANERLRNADTTVDDVNGLTAGTGLALLLRRRGLALRPDKPLGQPPTHRIVAMPATTEVKSDDRERDSWPVGWKSDARPRELAPAMFEFLNAQIEGYSLREALDVIGPRIKVPVYWDHAALAKHNINPQQIQISVPRSRTYLKRLLDQALFQARLHGELRVDEAGTVFYWITK